MQKAIVMLNSLLLGETITTNVKLMANYFNTFLQVLHLNSMKRLLKLKTHFHIIWNKLMMKLSFFPQQLKQT